MPRGIVTRTLGGIQPPPAVGSDGTLGCCGKASTQLDAISPVETYRGRIGISGALQAYQIGVPDEAMRTVQLVSNPYAQSIPFAQSACVGPLLDPGSLKQ